MIAGIKEFFARVVEPGIARDGIDEHALRVATAALLLEMMRMDNRIADAERDAVRATLQQRFALDAGELDALVALAAAEAREANGYHQFTSLINQRCDLPQKLRIVENLWQVALVDGHLDAHELHLMRRLTDLLHIPHAENIAAKQRAREATGVAAG